MCPRLLCPAAYKPGAFLDQELGREEPAATSQSLLPPGGVFGNSLAHQVVSSAGGSVRYSGDTGGFYPSFPAPAFPGYSTQLRDDFSREKSQHETVTNGGTAPLPWFPRLDHRAFGCGPENAVVCIVTGFCTLIIPGTCAWVVLCQGSPSPLALMASVSRSISSWDRYVSRQGDVPRHRADMVCPFHLTADKQLMAFCVTVSQRSGVFTYLALGSLPRGHSHPD